MQLFHSLHGMPLPAVTANFRDVAIIFHAHCLSPFRFYTDMKHRTRRHFSNLWSKGLVFPLERLHGLISNGIWSDEQSQSIWDSLYSAPYQLWEADPTSGAELRLQEVSFSCPWCSESETRVANLDSFTETHITKTAISQCSVCGHKFNADTLSAQYLKEDMTGFVTTQDAWYSPFMIALITGVSKEQYLVQMIPTQKTPAWT